MTSLASNAAALPPPSPSLLRSPQHSTSAAPNNAPPTLPKLQLPLKLDASSPLHASSTHSCVSFPASTSMVQQGFSSQSPSSPNGFSQLLQAVEYAQYRQSASQVLPTGKRSRSESYPLPSLYRESSSSDRLLKYARTTLPSMNMISSLPRQSMPLSAPLESTSSTVAPLSRPTSPTETSSRLVWETVLRSGEFPSELCLSENSGGQDDSSEDRDGSPRDMVRGRWTFREMERAQTLIHQVESGLVKLPAGMSARQYLADHLNCDPMRVTKKWGNLQYRLGGADETNDAHPHMSIRHIMNENGEPQTSKRKKPAVRALKRSDYSQHRAVRSGRWSSEEETYAKAMIEAFKSGYIPLHGNVSLRKFLSEVLICHPMRISKKFVGYVRKYHWYRIAARECDLSARRKALEHLCHLERNFWSSLQQSGDFPLAPRSPSVLYK